jgi:hypothetical protein
MGAWLLLMGNTGTRQHGDLTGLFEAVQFKLHDRRAEFSSQFPVGGRRLACFCLFAMSASAGSRSIGNDCCSISQCAAINNDESATALGRQRLLYDLTMCSNHRIPVGFCCTLWQ